MSASYSAVAPHALAVKSGERVLEEGGTAMEASVAMAAVLAVVYPHMSGIGGDSFWLVHQPQGSIVGIDGAGRTPTSLDLGWYKKQGLTSIPFRGIAAMNTLAGTVSGWKKVLELGPQRLSLNRILADAVSFARDGYQASFSQSEATAFHRVELSEQPGFAEVFLNEQRRSPEPGDVMRQPALANTLQRLADSGLDDFYRGEVAQSIVSDLQAIGSPLDLPDLQAQHADMVTPLAIATKPGTLYNCPPPTQGAASLAILGLFDRLFDDRILCDSPDHIHLLVEATKHVFEIRDQIVRDPIDMQAHDLSTLLGERNLDALAARINMERASSWPRGDSPADTTWFGAADSEGRVVSGIQSLYHEFGSGVVLPRTGICWQNRCSAFSLNPASPRVLKSGRKPFHTLNPALALLHDGRVLAYGTMGGDGQPQTQAALFTRAIYFGQSLRMSIAAPRWLLGRTWGAESTTLKIEEGIGLDTIAALQSRGHDVEIVKDLHPMMGHAGAVMRCPDGLTEGACDPRSDGSEQGPENDSF